MPTHQTEVDNTSHDASTSFINHTNGSKLHGRGRMEMIIPHFSHNAFELLASWRHFYLNAT